MKRSLVYLLAFVVLAGWVGTLIARDPGYVLISYDGASLQSGLWVFLGLLLVMVISAYYLLRLLNVVSSMSGRFKTWGSERNRSKATRLTTRGLIYLQEGDFERAEKFLVSGADYYELPAINFIAAAKAAEARNDPSQREAYLRQAFEADTSAGPAIALASAEMAANREDWRACLALLEEEKDNRSIVTLKKRALESLAEWQLLNDLLPQIRKLSIGSVETVTRLEKRIVLKRLAGIEIADEQLSMIFKKASEAVKSDPEVIRAFCLVIKNEKEAETILRATLKKTWHPELVKVYGALGKETLPRRIKTAESWLKQHPGDGALHQCLGMLFESNGDREKAKAAFEKSIEIGNKIDASKSLAALLAFEGDYEKSNEYFRLALND